MDKNKAAVEMFNGSAELYQTKYMDVSAYKKSLDQLCKNIGSKEVSILELGCGPGNITKYLLDYCPQYKVLGTDLAPNMIKLAKANCPTADFKMLDCRLISTLKKQFDVLLFGFCFPYLNQTEVEKTISDAHSILTTNGLLYISTIHGEYTDSDVKRSSTSGEIIYCYYHHKKFFLKVLNEIGFDIIDLTTQLDETDKTTTDIIIVATKRS